tara:strand:- start:2477 stop:3526 length:1050 start_codon:yes stop_codon:yes gene_type:complete
MKKIIILSLIILFFTKTQNLFSSTDTFTVDNIEVIGTINDQNYKNRQLETAFRKGFEKLILNIVKKEDQKELLSTDLKTIKLLLSNYRIVEENTQGNKYKLITDITFDRNIVSQFLFKKNISYAEVKKLEIIIYPILISNSELSMFSKNKFFEEWNENEDFENINFVLPVEDVEDIDFIKKNLSVLEEIDLNRIVDNYEIRNSAILIFRYDNKKLNAFMKTNLEGVKKAKKINFEKEELENKESRNNIIKNAKYYINELWKEENLIDISVPSYLVVNTKIKDSSSLEKIIKTMKKISLIENYIVQELDNKSAKIKIKFFGKIQNLQNSFLRNGIEFKIIDDKWNLNLKS